MRVAALYDIHANLPALEAVLDEIRRENVDQIVVGGDVLPGPMPRESMAVLRKLSIPVRFIYGNGEHDILAVHHGEELSRVPEQFHEAMRWCAKQLSPECLDEIAAWPLTLRLDIPGIGNALFCHATPRDDNELFTSLTPVERLRPIFDEAGASVVICGHTHMQFDRTVGNTRIVNAGSVGMPFGEPGAYWVMLGPDMELRRTAYDVVDAAERLEATAYPQAARFDVTRPPPEAEMVAVFEAAAIR